MLGRRPALICACLFFQILDQKTNDFRTLFCVLSCCRQTSAIIRYYDLLIPLICLHHFILCKAVLLLAATFQVYWQFQCRFLLKILRKPFDSLKSRCNKHWLVFLCHLPKLEFNQDVHVERIMWLEYNWAPHKFVLALQNQ